MQLVKLNLARNCLKYLIRTYGINEIFIPYYTCPAVWIAAREEGCRIIFYHIDKNFYPVNPFPQNAYIIYTNYFGMCSKNCRKLAAKYKNLIIDNSQAFYTQPEGLASFYSLRKFFNVPSGAFLYTRKLSQENFEQDNLNLNPANFHNNYTDFVKNELTLNKEKSIKNISELSKKLFEKIDFEKDKNTRISLFKEYKKILNKDNYIKLSPDENEIPYCYPFCPKKDLYKEKVLKNNIILLKLWKNYPPNMPEATLNNTAALPLNDIQYAQKILQIFSEK